METIIVKKKNEAFLQITAPIDIQFELGDHFSFEVEGARFQPKVKAGIWDGRIKLFNQATKTLYAGLFDDLQEFCKARDYHIQLDDCPAYGLPGSKINLQLDDVKSFVDELNFHTRGAKMEFRDYQYEAVLECLTNKRKVLISPTASGKSAVIAAVTRYILQDDDTKVLIIVPTTQLCLQMKNDFTDYFSEGEYDVENNTHIIMGGKEKHNRAEITISTWQSLAKNKVTNFWLNEFAAIIVDECHLASAKELGGLMEKATDVPYRLGFTGTLSKARSNKMMIKGLFGEIVKVTTSKKLMDTGQISSLAIKCLVLDYSKETKSLFKRTAKVDYIKERAFLVAHDRRNKFIRNLALSLEGNTLILYTLVEDHGAILYKMIEEKAGDRKVHFIHGGVDVEERDSVREITEQSNNSIIIASSGTFSTGTNIRKIHNIIFASPSKSMIRVLQSIGRGLRLSAGKDKCNLYDISDRLSASKIHSNHTYKHFIERLKIYNSEEFEYKIIEVQIEG